MNPAEILTNLLNTGRVAHAYLFEGPANSDKKRAANEFARMLLCTAENKAKCDSCASCLMFRNSSHPDYHFLGVSGDTIKIREHVEPFFQDIRLSPVCADRKIYIIDEAHKMNSASQNSILKTLEEPFSNVVIILLTENSEMLLSTIRSRVIKYHFNIEEENERNEEREKIFFNVMKNIESRKAADRISAVSELSSLKSELSLIFDMMQIYYRNSLVSKYTNGKMLINMYKTDKMSPYNAVKAVKYIDEARFALKSNANVQMVADVLVTKLSDCYK